MRYLHVTRNILVEYILEVPDDANAEEVEEVVEQLRGVSPLADHPALLQRDDDLTVAATSQTLQQAQCAGIAQWLLNQ